MNDKSITIDMVAAAMDLFKQVPMSYFTRERHMTPAVECLKRGFVFITDGGSLIDPIPNDLFKQANALYGMNALNLNQTFWKSFKTVQNMDPTEYLAHQLFHYFSTYGAESLGYKAVPYVPFQALDLPDGLKIPAKNIVLLRAVETYKIEDSVNHFLETVSAVSPAQKNRIEKLMPLSNMPADKVKSFELQVMKHKMDGTVPSDPVNFLRFVVYATTNETLLIKNKKLCGAIKLSYHRETYLARDLFEKADKTALAGIFLRYRPIFLAFKAHRGCSPIINKLRRMADQYHRPLSDVTVKNVTNLIRQERMEDVYDVLGRATNRELVKIGNAIGHKLGEFKQDNPGVYAVRNGRTFVRKDTAAFTDKREYHNLYCFLEDISTDLRKRLKTQLKGRTFVLPNGIDYAVPTSEKQMTGVIPWGTMISVPKNGAITAGIHWFDQQHQRVDIDLHMNSATQHFGWNGGYNGKSIIYTGDQTAAPKPNGAAEAFAFVPSEEPYIMGVNLYSGPENTEFTFLMSKQNTVEDLDRQFIFDPAEVLFAPVPLKFLGDAHQMTLGMFTDEGFFIYGGSLSNGIVPTANYGDFIAGVRTQLECHWRISELLNLCGANIINEEEYEQMEDKSEVTSLMPADLTATTLFDLVDGNLFDEQK